MSVFFQLTRCVFADSLAYAYLAPILALQFISMLAVSNAYIYDFAEIFFSCATLYLLIRRRFLAYLVMLALATLNKETSVYVTVFFALYFYNRLPRRDFLRLMVAQVAIYAGLQFLIRWHFAGFSGVGVPNLLAQNLQGIAAEPIQFLVGITALLLPMAYRWNDAPQYLRYAACMILPNAAAYLLASGIFVEMRAFYWSLPVATLLYTHALVKFSGLDRVEALRSHAP